MAMERSLEWLLLQKHARRGDWNVQSFSARTTDSENAYHVWDTCSDRCESSLGNVPVTTTTKIFPKGLRNRREAHCNTHERRTAIQMGGVLTVFPFPQSVGAPKALQWKLGAYCNTNRRYIAILFWDVVLVGVSVVLLNLLKEVWKKAPKGQYDAITGYCSYSVDNVFNLGRLILFLEVETPP